MADYLEARSLPPGATTRSCCTAASSRQACWRCSRRLQHATPSTAPVVQDRCSWRALRNAPWRSFSVTHGETAPLLLSTPADWRHPPARRILVSLDRSFFDGWKTGSV